MENYYSSYPDSGDSSPRSREIDCENASFDEPLPPNYKVKFMCSYGGKIQPRSHDNQLSYVGGDTKILAADRHIRFSTLISKLTSVIDPEEPSICFKYQLPGEDLDALISVTNDEDLEHMMLEYDRLHRASSKPARLRLFLFPANASISSAGSTEPKSDRQWFVDALNSAPAPQTPPIQTIDTSSPPAAGNPDFLFGLDKSSAATGGKLQHPAVESANVEAPVENVTGSDLAKEIAAESAAEIQRQIQELQRLQIASQEQSAYQRRSDDGVPRTFAGDFYVQKPPEKPPATMTVPVPATVSQGYWTERQMIPPSGYAPPPNAATGTDQPVYFVQASAPVYQQASVRPVTGQVGQGYYVSRVVPDVYREQQAVYSMGPPPPAVQKVGPAPYAEGGVGVVRPQGVGVADTGYPQVAYDSAGRQLFYTAPGGGVLPSYQTVPPAAATTVDVRQAGVLNPEAKLAKPQAS